MCHVEFGHNGNLKFWGQFFFFFFGTNMTSVRLNLFYGFSRNDANYINLLKQTNEQKGRVMLGNEAFPK